MRSIKLWLLVSLLLSLNLLADRGLFTEYQKKHGNEKKIALVIGNGKYKNFSKLKNPTNDSDSIARVLDQRGFEVIHIQNKTKKQMDKAIRKFSKKLKYAKVGLFYFAGHGIEVEKKNYIIPLKSDIKDSEDVPYEAIAVNEIVDRMRKSNTRLNMILLDACRNNPFKRGVGGLAPMNQAKGTLIAYATDSGSSALDNPDENNGLFTKHILQAMNTPNLNQRDFFHKVRQSVYNESGETQLPYLNDGTIGVFYFNITDTPSYQKPKPQGNSSFEFSSNKPTLYSLTVNTTPSNAQVTITNITPKYKDGILLEAGKYKLKIKAEGYYSKEGQVELKSDLSISVALEKKRIAQTPKPSYSSNDTWRDSDTNLIWQVPVDSKEYNWSEAKRYCRDLHLGGYSDWRLPSRDELKSILTKKSYPNSKSYGGKTYIKKPLLKSMTMKYQWFWSSTEKDTGWFEDGSAWIVVFNDGDDYNYDVSDRDFVRCVRQ
jgi:hypothetical protein